MTEPHHTGCPDESVLAAFIEGKLPAAEHAPVVRHVADCPYCVPLIGETSLFLDERDAEVPARQDRGTRWWISVAAGIALLVVPLLVWRVRAPDDPLSDIRRIAATLPKRPVEGRLVGFAHRPFVAPRFVEAIPPVDVSLAAEAERIERRYAGRNAEDLHARGVAALLTGRHSEAVALLTAAARAASKDAKYWNDLSVAQIAAAAKRGDAALAAAALESADRAISLAPSAEAYFNRAIAVEALGDSRAAERAYEKALATDTQSPWRDEIETQIQRLRN